MLGERLYRVEIDDVQNFIKFIKVFVKLGKNVSPSYTNILGKKDTYELVVCDSVLYIGSDKSLSTNTIELSYDNISTRAKKLKSDLETFCPNGITFKFSANVFNKWIKDNGEKVKYIDIYENGIKFVVYAGRIEKIFSINKEDVAYVNNLSSKLEKRIDMENPLFVIEKEEFNNEHLNIYETDPSIPILFGFNTEEDTYNIKTQTINKGEYDIIFRLFKSVFLKNTKTKDADASIFVFDDLEYDNAYILCHAIANKKYEGYQYFRIH